MAQETCPALFEVRFQLLNLRILGLVAAYLTVAGLAVATAQLASRPSPWVEHIRPAGVPASARVQSGLQISMQGSTLSLRLPHCSVEFFSEPFFLHVYPGWSGPGPGADFINMDFDFKSEAPKWAVLDGVTYCDYTKELKRLAPRAVVIGQFDTQEDGACCNILWSRSFFPAQ